MRQSHKMPRCIDCRMHEPLCICAKVRVAAARVRERVRTRVVVVMQAKEARRASNTGHLVPQLLPGAEVRRWGGIRGTAPLDDLLSPAGGVYLLFPDPEAGLVDRRLHHEAPDTPLTLVVPDGSWRQATRMAHRDPVLSRLPRLALPAGGPPRWTVRTAPRPDGLCTLESVARALGVLDGDDLRVALEGVLVAHLHAILRMRMGGPAPASEKS